MQSCTELFLNKLSQDFYLIASVFIEDDQEDSHEEDDADDDEGIGQGVPGLCPGLVGLLVEWGVDPGMEIN